MRIRAGQITLLVMALLAAAVVLMVVYGGTGETIPGGGGDAEGALPPWQSSAKEVPVISVVGGEKVDMGLIPNDRPSTKTLTITNKGLQPLKISDVQTNCACTIGKMADTTPIAPGKNGELVITVNPNRIFGFHSLKTLTIFSNDPDRPTVPVEVEARVEPEFVLEPENFDFGVVEKGVPSVSEIRLTTRQESPLLVKSLTLYQPGTEEGATADLPPVKLEILPVPVGEWKTADRAEHILQASLPADMPSGPFNTPVYVATDTPRFPHHRFFARGEVKAPYKVETPDGSTTLTMTPGVEAFTLKIRGTGPISNPSATAEKGIVTAACTLDSDNTLLLVEVRAAEPLGEGRHMEILRVSFLLGGKEFVEPVPVKLFILNRGEENLP